MPFIYSVYVDCASHNEACRINARSGDTINADAVLESIQPPPRVLATSNGVDGEARLRAELTAIRDYLIHHTVPQSQPATESDDEEDEDEKQEKKVWAERCRLRRIRNYQTFMDIDEFSDDANENAFACVVSITEFVREDLDTRQFRQDGRRLSRALPDWFRKFTRSIGCADAHFFFVLKRDPVDVAAVVDEAPQVGLPVAV